MFPPSTTTVMPIIWRGLRHDVERPSCGSLGCKQHPLPSQPTVPSRPTWAMSSLDPLPTIDTTAAMLEVNIVIGHMIPGDEWKHHGRQTSSLEHSGEILTLCGRGEVEYGWGRVSQGPLNDHQHEGFSKLVLPLFWQLEVAFLACCQASSKRALVSYSSYFFFFSSINIQNLWATHP